MKKKIKKSNVLKHEVEIYYDQCPACGFPQNDKTLIKWLKKQGFPSLAKCLIQLKDK